MVLLFPEQVYPHTEEQQLSFPLLDMLKANMEYKEEDYASYIQQYNLPEKFRSFVKKNIGEIMSSKVSNILNGHIDCTSFSEDMVCRAFISNYLGEKKLQEWEQLIIKMIILDGIAEEKKRTDFWYKLSKNFDASKAFSEKLDKLFGLTPNFNAAIKMKNMAESLKYNSITQLLDAVPGDTYKQYKISNSVVLDQMNKIYELGTHDRLLSEKFAQAMNILAADIKEEEIINIYGIDANYYYLTESLCWPILKEIVEEKLMADPEQVNDRMRELSLKLPVDSDIQIAIRFIEQSALYYAQVHTTTEDHTEEPKTKRPRISVLQEKSMSFRMGQTGVSYEKLFAPYMREAKEITIEDPYIRASWQIKNFMEFALMLINTRPVDDLKLNLITNEEEDKIPDLIDKLDDIKDDLASYGIEFTYKFRDFHDRCIKTDTGWTITLGRGLDMFEKYSPYSIASSKQDMRKCKEFTATFMKNKNV